MPIDQVAIVTALIFIGGLIYAAGRNAQRLDRVERDVDRIGQRFDAVNDRLDHIAAMIRGEET